MQKLNPTQIGALRNCPSSTAQPRSAHGPAKAMLNKLVKTGHVELAEEKFRRTDAGDIALTDFDGALTQKQVAILISIDQGKAGTNAIAGFNTLLRADLIRIYGLRNFPTITLTEEGKRVLRQHADTTQAE